MDTLIALLLLVPQMIFSGYTLSVLWSWFLTPLGVDPIGIAHSIGLASLITLLTVEVDKKSDEQHEPIVLILAGFIRCVAALGIGWACTQFM